MVKIAETIIDDEDNITFPEVDFKKISETARKHDFKQLDVQNTEYDNISVSVDYHKDPTVDSYASILYTPDMNDTATHYHIHLEDDSAVELYNWLDKYIKGKRLDRKASYTLIEKEISIEDYEHD